MSWPGRGLPRFFLVAKTGEVTPQALVVFLIQAGSFVLECATLVGSVGICCWRLRKRKPLDTPWCWKSEAVVDQELKLSFVSVVTD